MRRYTVLAAYRSMALCALIDTVEAKTRSAQACRYRATIKARAVAATLPLVAIVRRVVLPIEVLLL